MFQKSTFYFLNSFFFSLFKPLRSLFVLTLLLTITTFAQSKTRMKFGIEFLDQNNFVNIYSVKQSDRNSSKTDLFHKPATYEPVQTSSKQNITYTSNEYGRVKVFRIKIKSLVLKLQPLEKCQFANCSHLIASHCTDIYSGYSTINRSTLILIIKKLLQKYKKKQFFVVNLKDRGFGGGGVGIVLLYRVWFPYVIINQCILPIPVCIGIQFVQLVYTIHP